MREGGRAGGAGAGQVRAPQVTARGRAPPGCALPTLSRREAVEPVEEGGVAEPTISGGNLQPRWRHRQGGTARAQGVAEAVERAGGGEGDGGAR